MNLATLIHICRNASDPPFPTCDTSGISSRPHPEGKPCKAVVVVVVIVVVVAVVVVVVVVVCLHIKPFFLPNDTSSIPSVLPDSSPQRDTNYVVTDSETREKPNAEESR